MTDGPYSKLSRHVLDNGLSVIIDERPLSATVFCGLYVRVGSRYETKENNGIAHFLEHLLFRDRGRRPTVKQIEATGGSVNGVTSLEHTCYYFDTLASEFQTAWDGLYRLVYEPDFGEREVELERNIILREVAGIKSNPLMIAYYAAMKEFLPNTSLALPPAGTRRSLKRISTSDIRQFYDAYYVPNNMFLLVVGGVDTEITLTAIRSSFADRQAGGVPCQSFRLPPRRDKRHELRLKTLVDQGYLGLGVRTGGQKDPYKYEMELLDVVLGSGRNSRIYKELKGKRALTDLILSVADIAPAEGAVLSDIGIWGVAVGTSPKDLAEAERVVLDEMNGVIREPLPPDELETAKSKLLGRFTIACESNSGRAAFYAATELARELLSTDQYRNRIKSVTCVRIQQAAVQNFDDKNIMILEVKPARRFGKILALLRFLLFKRL